MKRSLKFSELHNVVNSHGFKINKTNMLQERNLSGEHFTNYTNYSSWTSQSHWDYIWALLPHFNTLNWTEMSLNRWIVCTWGFWRDCSSAGGPEIRRGTSSAPASLWMRGRGFGQRTRACRWWWTRYTELCPAVGSGGGWGRDGTNGHIRSYIIQTQTHISSSMLTLLHIHAHILKLHTNTVIKMNVCFTEWGFVYYMK